MSIKDKLQIILITYNRKKYVQQVFEQFLLSLNSPVKDFDILILDNNSTDGTENYVKLLIEKYPNIKYQKNKYNIGLSGNIAKAMEIANKEYLWIICDDDKYDWSNWNELEKAVKNNEDIICTARYAISDANTNSIEYQILQFTFVPAIVIKTKLFNDTIMRNTFDNIFTLFPHLFPIISFINQNKKIYVLNKAIVNNGMDIKNTDCSYNRGMQSDNLCQRTKTITWIVGYANVCSMVKDQKLRYKMMLTAIDFIYGSFSKFCKDMQYLYFKQENWMQLIDVWLQLDTTHSIKLIASLIRRKFFGASIEDDKYVVRFFGIKFKIKTYREQDDNVIKFLGITVKRHIENRHITLCIFNKTFKI